MITMHYHKIGYVIDKFHKIPQKQKFLNYWINFPLKR
jgi:hypothetical protein